MMFSKTHFLGWWRIFRKHSQLAYSWHCKKRDALQDDIFMRYCLVHFKRTLFRLARESSLIPYSESKHFISSVLQLLNFRIGETDKFFVHFTDLLKRYSRVSKWLQWHIRPGIATILFPACKNFRSRKDYTRWETSLPDNSNAAESMNRTMRPFLGKPS